MGFKIEVNWALKLPPEQLNEDDLREDGIYQFRKDGYRIYPVGMPIDLLNEQWQAVAQVIVLRCTLSDGQTEGEYIVLKIYKGSERMSVSGYWREIARRMGEG